MSAVNVMEFLDGLSTTLWIGLAIYGFVIIHKWNKRFAELHEQFKRDMEETE